MLDLTRPPRLPALARPIAGLLIGAVGAAGLSIATAQGYLNATVVTGAGYTGSTKPLDPAGQLLMLFAWLALGGLAGYVGRSGSAFAGLWVGTLLGSVVGFLGDPDGNILWLDVLVTVVGVSLFVTPGFFLGAALAGRMEGQAPDGSGHRPTPPPLWLRGRRHGDSRAAPDRVDAAGSGLSPRQGATPPPVDAPAAGRVMAADGTAFPASAYARPTGRQPE